VLTTVVEDFLIFASAGVGKRTLASLLSTKMHPLPTRINLALGGGGAKGFVHVGVIDELVENGIEVASIVGTSMGAIVGALFAYGVGVTYGGLARLDAQKKAIGAVKAILLGNDFGALKDPNYWSLLRKGAVRGDKISDWLRRSLLNYDTNDSVTFDQLKFDLTITTTDAYTGEQILLTSGAVSGDTKVSHAVRASISIPLVFREIEIEVNQVKKLCWDGGLTGNCRFDLALEKDPDILTIGSSVTYPGNIVPTSHAFGAIRPLLVLNHASDVALRSMEDGMARALGARMASVRIVRPNLEGVGTMDFKISRTVRQKLFDNGRAAMSKVLHDK
jgi:NTE family protein